jgi:TPR repeat protein
MAEAAASSGSFTGRTRKADVARAALLDAARRVAMQSGVDAVTLSAVGDEANMARATVYSYFRGRGELIQAVIADDLNLLLRAMRKAAGLPEPPKAPPTPSRIVRFELKQQGHHNEEDVDFDADDEFVAQGSLAAPRAEPAKAAEAPASNVAFEKLEDHFSTFEPEQFEVSEFEHGAPVEAPTTESETVNEVRASGPDEVRVEAPAEAAASDEAVAPVAAQASAEENTVAEQAETVTEDDSASLAAKLPDREERIRLVGKRLLATQELRDTMKKIAPVYTPEAEGVDIVAKLEEAATKRETGLQERIERRFVQLERNLSALEERSLKSGESVTAAIASLRSSLSDLESRTTAADKVQHETMLKMMAEIRDAMRRLDRMEGANNRFPEGRMHDSEEPATIAPAIQEEPSSEEKMPAEEPTPATTEEMPDVSTDAAAAVQSRRQDDYLAAARRAMTTVADEIDKSNKARDQAKTRQTKFALFGMAAVGLVLVCASFAAREIATRSPAGGQVAATHRGLPARLKIAALTPLDHITADARAGKPEAEVEVGVKYLNGDGIPKDEAEAAKWIQRAAATGYAPGEGWLGTLYDRGKGVAHDPAQAIAWFQKAAKKGNRKSMHDLGLAFAQGDGVPVNFFEAAHWFSRAATLGYVDSAFNLAVLYERGDGVPQSLIDAYKWYAIAAHEGDQESSTRMEAIAPELSPDSLAAAKSAAAAFKPGASVPADTAKLVAHDMMVSAP